MKYHSPEAEVKLVKNLSRGNLLAFNILFRCYSGRLYRFAYGYLKSDEESEELVQEVFTRIWEKRKELKSELSFKSYLFTIAFNIIKKHYRKEACELKYFKTKLNDDLDLETTQKVTYNSLYQYITELVDKLPLRRREIFIKSRFEGLSTQEIAEDLKINHKTVENQLSDALRYIRSKLKSEILPFILFSSLFVL